MSAILFHSWDRPDVRVAGPERAHLGVLTEKTSAALMGRKPMFGQPPQLEDINRVMQLDSPSLRLACRIHYQCEIHCWVRGANRNWLAGMIEQALGAGVFRESIKWCEREGDPWQDWPMGWRDVIAMLRERDDQPVFMSYTVTDPFPSTYGLDIKQEEWWALPVEERWRRAEEVLMKESEATAFSRELRPETFDNYRFD